MKDTNEIKILHLFPRLMSLYGDYGNVAILKKTLAENGYTVTVNEYEDGTPDFDCALIYIGAGIEKNVLIAKDKLLPFKNELKSALKNGVKLLSTGSSVALFGKTLDGSEALDIASYSVKTANKRYLSDILTDENNLFSSRIVGYVNTSYEFENANGIAKAAFGGQGNGLDVGVHENGLMGINLTGPFLVKNAPALEYVMERLTGKEIKIPKESNQYKAYETTVKELKHRMESEK